MTEVNPFSRNTDIKTESYLVNNAPDTCGPMDYEGYLSNSRNPLDNTDSLDINNKKKLIPFGENSGPKANGTGLGNRVSDKELEGMATAGNNFSLFTHAESVAVNLPYSTAIVTENNLYSIYKVNEKEACSLISGDSCHFGNKVVAVIKDSKTIYNNNFSSVAEVPNSSLAYAQGNKIMLEGKEFKVSGLNVYDLSEISASGNQSELERTLKVISDSGANTVRFMAFSSHKADTFLKIFDTSKNLGLDLKFVPVFGNHWADMEAPGSKFIKKDDWYINDYKKDYLPHVLETVKALADRPEILMFELVNEPEGTNAVIRNFADDVSAKIRQVEKSAENNHLISFGLGGAGHKGMIGHEFKDLTGIPNIDIVTAHDYTFDKKQSTETTISPVFQEHMQYASELDKPFVLGEIGIKVRENGTEQKPVGKELRTPEEAMEIKRKRLELYKKEEISGALLWGPQPLGHSVDGGGHGFTFKEDSPVQEELHNVYEVFED
jgi:hypothetical protein